MGRTVPRLARTARALLVGALLVGALPVGALPVGALPVAAGAREASAQGPDAPHKEEPSVAPTKVDVEPVARDEQIRARIQSVLEATGWFVEPQVQVEQGVVFLGGLAETAELKKWAGDLARNTQDVVAVANRMVVPEPSPWDFSEAWVGLARLWHDFIRSLPFLVSGLLILALSWLGARQAARGADHLLRRRVQVNLLRSVLSRAIGLLVFLIGLYVVLRVAGLTQLALTVIGGTGLVGLALGIAFRDITENFLASVFLSMQRPFATGDLISVADVTGFVQQLNVRTTVLMTPEGNLVQVPNAAVYKNTIRNFTANPNRRESFLVGIGYEESITRAQEIARRVLEEHPAVLNDPEPLVLTDELARSTVNLRIYFWVNGHEHSWVKVRSALIRLVKRAFQDQGISMPDEAREVRFPRGVPVTLLEGRATSGSAAAAPQPKAPAPSPQESAASATKAEAGLSSEAIEIEGQARGVQPLQESQNLLQADAGPDQAP